MKKILQRTTTNKPPQFLDLHPVLQRVYAFRGIQTEQELQLSLKFLQPATRLKGLEQALEILVSAIQQQKKILIVGDFDADGATSTTLCVLALRQLGALYVDYLVPNRFEFGYGLTPEIVAIAKDKNPDLIITVDNGIASLDGVSAAKAANIDVLITDHHLPGAQLPQADAIINPRQPGCEFPSKNLAGVGVIFYLMAALRTHLQEQSWYQYATPASMAELLDIVALGTVADVVPLDYNNRILVQQGLARIRAGRCRPGILALLAVAKRDYRQIVANDLGFAVGPRLNAAGRLEDMSLGIECLLAEDSQTAQRIALQLEELNLQRRAIEGQMKEQALALLANMANRKAAQLPWGLCLFEASWHQGVVGILASRMKEKYHRPCIAFARVAPGELKGSARSVPGLHIRDALDAIASRSPDLISKFGGHAMAAGLSLAENKLAEFEAAFDQEVRHWLRQEDLTQQVLSDGQLTEQELDLPLANLLKEAGPWGQDFPEPVFDGEFELLNQRIVGEKHLKMVLGLPERNGVIDAIAFNVDLTQWPNPKAQRVAMAYKLVTNEFRGNVSPQLMVEWLEPVSE